MSPPVRNWIFLGDSLTEGVGSKRVSHVAELAKELRASGCTNANVHEFRLRQVDLPSFNRFIDFNVAGLMNLDEQQSGADLWLWNLACEGQTIDSDLRWLPLIASLRPELVVIFRGSLESIIRPAMIADGGWPWWVPQSWRGYAAMDPRCYFSTTWWRNAKQTTVDALKQKVRLKLLQSRPGKPLMDPETLASHLSKLIKQLQALGTRVLVLGLLPVDQDRFPGSAEQFKSVNERLRLTAETEDVEYVNWSSQVNGDELFYRDGFHPNEAGAVALAKILRNRLCKA